MISSSAFRAFSSSEFVEWGPWRQLERILQSNGGAYGISGPRGAGKSWLIQRGVSAARDRNGLGLWFPAPSNYDSEAFLRAFANDLSAELQRRFPKGAPHWSDRLASWWTVAVGCALVGLAGENLLTTPPSAREGIGLYMTSLATVGLSLVIGGTLGVLRRRNVGHHLFRQACMLQEHVRYAETQSRSEGASIGVSSKVFSISSEQARERTLTERPATRASLTYDVRALLQLVATRTRAPVVVGIDELDKIHDPKDAKKLLRDIKGIFEIEGVHFLVSVSDEARRSLSLASSAKRTSSIVRSIRSSTSSPDHQ